MDEAKVLVTDDEVDFTEALAQRLSKRGMKVEAVDNGAAALEKVSHASYDPIILDLAMPYGRNRNA